jgi:hypothetical protein
MPRNGGNSKVWNKLRELISTYQAANFAVKALAASEATLKPIKFVRLFGCGENKGRQNF